jgi:hypothetical protein
MDIHLKSDSKGFCSALMTCTSILIPLNRDGSRLDICLGGSRKALSMLANTEVKLEGLNTSLPLRYQLSSS